MSSLGNGTFRQQPANLLEIYPRLKFCIKTVQFVAKRGIYDQPNLHFTGTSVFNPKYGSKFLIIEKILMNAGSHLLAADQAARSFLSGGIFGLAHAETRRRGEDRLFSDTPLPEKYPANFDLIHS